MPKRFDENMSEFGSCNSEFADETDLEIREINGLGDFGMIKMETSQKMSMHIQRETLEKPNFFNKPEPKIRSRHNSKNQNKSRAKMAKIDMKSDPKYDSKSEPKYDQKYDQKSEPNTNLKSTSQEPTILRSKSTSFKSNESATKSHVRSSSRNALATLSFELPKLELVDDDFLKTYSRYSCKHWMILGALACGVPTASIVARLKTAPKTVGKLRKYIPELAKSDKIDKK